jgi:hypothetical protein
MNDNNSDINSCNISKESTSKKSAFSDFLVVFLCMLVVAVCIYVAAGCPKLHIVKSTSYDYNSSGELIEDSSYSVKFGD